MKVRVVIPWRPNGHSERERNILLTSQHLSPVGSIRWADSEHQPFNRAESRNSGVRACMDADVVVVCDADFLPPLDAVLAACKGALKDGLLHQPFTEALYLSEAETASYLDDRSLPVRSGSDLTGGCFVMTPEAWFEAGGMDPRFLGWGGEDDAFRIAAETLLGPRVHHEGVMPHLYHPSSAAFGTEAHSANLNLLRRYVAAAGNPDAIRQITQEWS